MIVVMKLVECGKCGLGDLGGVEAETRQSWLPAFSTEGEHIASWPSPIHAHVLHIAPLSLSS